MEGLVKRFVKVWVCVCAAVVPVSAQPSLPPNALKPDRTEEVRRSEDARRAAEAAKAANSTKKSSSSSKSRTAEMRGFTFSDNARGNRPVIIKSGNDPKVREQLKEDLLVMCRILEKAAQPHISDVHKAA